MNSITHPLLNKSFQSEIDYMETFFSEKIDKYCIVFNSKLYTYKTFNPFKKKVNYFINTYSLSKN